MIKRITKKNHKADGWKEEQEEIKEYVLCECLFMKLLMLIMKDSFLI